MICICSMREYYRKGALILLTYWGNPKDATKIGDAEEITQLLERRLESETFQSNES